MKLIITRHGETEENILGIIQGQLPGKLSALGIAQAKKVALRLKDEKIDYIYSSDLARTLDTAKEIAKFHKKVPIELVKDLREKYFGQWQGKKKTDLGFSKTTDFSGFSPEDGETSEKIFNRAKRFLYKILTKHPNDTILIAGHTAINKALIAVIMNKTSKDIESIKNTSNASITVIEIDENKNHKVNLFNCKKHLD